MNRAPAAPLAAPRAGRTSRRRLLGTSVAAAILATVRPAGAAVDPAQLPPPAERPVSFTADIQPILDTACLRCHGAERPKSGYRLDSRELALQGGDLGVAIVPGRSAESPLIHYVARLVPDMEMPPEGKAEPLTAEQVSLLRRWIDDGADWGEPAAEFQFTATPAVRWISVDGNVARFRQHTGMREGWGGGLEEYSLRYDVDSRTEVSIEGRALQGPDDYRFSARVERDGLGWARVAYREFSRFDDDTGGYYAPFGTPAPRWGDDFVMRHRQATAEVGLNLPDWPRLRLGYDLHIRQGTESTLHWGNVTEGGTGRNIFPGRKKVDETTHRLSFDLSHDWDGLRVSDQAWIEWHDQENQRTQIDFVPDFGTVATDQQDSWQGANVLRLERSVRDWLYLSGGYLYSQLEDAAGFRLENFNPLDPSLPPTLDIASDNLTLRRRSHVMNANAMLGPWEQLHFYAGLQADWTRQEGFASGPVFAVPTAYDANIDRATTDETFGLRYAGLPNTVFFAETRFQQESASHFEEGLTDTVQFLRDTDSTADTKDYEVGFTVSPWRQVSFESRYRHRDRANDYDHLQDVDTLGTAANGYPAFIRSRDTLTDEVDFRLVLQPLRWLKTTVRYTLATTDYETTTDGWTDDSTLPPTLYPGGSTLAGEYDAQTVSAGLVIRPWSRLYLAPTLNWTTSDTRTALANGAQVVPYEGDTWSLLASASYVVDEKTDLLASYYFSSADYEQDNEVGGLPLGIRYSRQGITAGILRRMKRDRTLRLEYAYFSYDEPTLGGAADYTAHGIFASLRIPWR